MRTILLTRAKRALVDDDVYEWLHEYNWAIADAHGDGEFLYGRRRARAHEVYLHRQIAGVPGLCWVGFRDGNGLNCQRDNLYVLDLRGEVIPWRGGAGRSEWRGVVWERETGLWRAELAGLAIGWYAAEADAARAFNAKAIEVYGERAAAMLNEIPFLSESVACSMPQRGEMRLRSGQHGRGYSQQPDGQFFVDVKIDGQRYKQRVPTEERAQETVKAICLAANAAERIPI